MPKIRWEDISNIRHNILSSLQKAVNIEQSAINLKKEILKEVDALNAIINRVPDTEKTDRSRHERTNIHPDDDGGSSAVDTRRVEKSKVEKDSIANSDISTASSASPVVESST